MGKVLKVANMAGHNALRMSEGYPTDMESCRSHLVFKDKCGVVVRGDALCGTIYKTKGGRSIGIDYPCSLCWDMAFNGVHNGRKGCWRYNMPQETCRRHYEKKEILKVVNSLSTEQYDDIAFFDDYDAWQKEDGVKELIAEYERLDNMR